MGILFKHGTIITAGDSTRADLLVEGQTIALIGQGLPAAWHEVVDCTDAYLLPGGVDAQTHVHLPLAHTSSNDDFASAHKAAAFGGTTTHLDVAQQAADQSLLGAVETWRAMAENRAQIDYALHVGVGTVDADSITDIASLRDAGVVSLKVALCGADMLDDSALFQVMRAAQQAQLLVLIHAENGALEQHTRQNLLANGRVEPFVQALARPPLLETEATWRAISIAGLTGCPAYFASMSCEGAVEMLRKGRALGYNVMGQTCAHYLFLTLDDHLDAPDFEGAKYVVTPPLRDWRDHTALWAALRDGTLQTVASDHAAFWHEGGIGPWREWPASADWGAYEAQRSTYRRPGKDLGNPANGGTFADIPAGLPGIEDRMMLLWHHGVNAKRITPSRFVEITSTHPAKIFGLYPRKGTLSIGADADIVVWDPNAEHTLKAETHHMRTDYNCYQGISVRGVPRQVYLRGRKIVDGERWLGGEGEGRYLPRTNITML
jgi:dihydropyrimidinase